MLTLKNIGKDYASSGGSIHALRCVNLTCRSRELVMILGSNASGKTALLEIISGQQPSSRGDMLMNGQSVRKFSDAQWSEYRRRVSLADVNLLLPDYTVAENIAMGIRLSGERRNVGRTQAAELLQLFGLNALADRYPGELSAAQRKLAALCCAMAGEPDVLLVDEPVLGLDPVSAKKVAAILREAAGYCLVITASRKPLYPEGDVRTVHMKDGTVESDSAPCTDGKTPSAPLRKDRGLGFGGVLSMAFSALRRRGSRVPSRVLVGMAAAFCAAFAMIVSGALLAHSAKVQESTLAAYPITVSDDTMSSDSLEALYNWLSEDGKLPAGTEIQPSYAGKPWIFMVAGDGSARQVNPTGHGISLWEQLPATPEARSAQYQLLYGRWPERYDEVAVLQYPDGTYNLSGLESIGILPDGETGEWKMPGYDALLHTTFRLVLPTESYYMNADGTWGSLREDSSYMAALMSKVPSLKIVGILRTSASSGGQQNAFIGYTHAMTEYIKDSVLGSDLIKAQQASPTVDVITGMPFDTLGLRSQTPAQKSAAMLEYVVGLDAVALRTVYQQLTGQNDTEQDMLSVVAETIAAMPAEEAAALYDSYVTSIYSPGSYDGNLALFGYDNVSAITELRLLATSLEGRQKLSELLHNYSAELVYSDGVETMVASANGFASGLVHFAALVCGAVLLCAIVAIRTPYAEGAKVRTRHWARLRGRGMSRSAVEAVCLWESLVLALPSVAAGIGAAWLLAGPICRLVGWGQLAQSCTLVLWQGGVLLAVMTAAAAVFAVLAAVSATFSWPGDVLYKGKE